MARGGVTLGRPEVWQRADDRAAVVSVVFGLSGGPITAVSDVAIVATGPAEPQGALLLGHFPLMLRYPFRHG